METVKFEKLYLNFIYVRASRLGGKVICPSCSRIDINSGVQNHAPIWRHIIGLISNNHCVAWTRQMHEDFPTTEERICQPKEETWSLLSGEWDSIEFMSILFIKKKKKKKKVLIAFTPNYSDSKTTWAHRDSISTQVRNWQKEGW
jgi:hypothetical protein